MCTTCGCGEGNLYIEGDEHNPHSAFRSAPFAPAARPKMKITGIKAPEFTPSQTEEGDLHYGHGEAGTHAPGMSQRRMLEVEIDVLDKNNRLAERNRARFAARKQLVLNLVSSPGSGKTTLLKAISARLTPQQGEVLYQQRSLYAMSEAERRRLLRTEWGVVHQHPMDGLRRQVSAGGNIGERLMATGARHYGNIRATAEKWLQEVEIPPSRIDDLPTTFSGGMQQRLQIARNLVTQPKLVFMDEPTGGLDVSVQARLLDLLRGLAVELNLAVVIVTHDLGVARLLANRLLVMKQGQVVESGLTDRVLDDPHHPYTQLLVSSVLQN